MTEKQPSMQEILGSIRRIIAEDSDEFGAACREQRRNGSAEQDGDAGAHNKERAARTEDGEGLLSVQAEGEAARAFGALRRKVVVTQGKGTSLDDVVREMLQPMLRQWLDAHLPGIVERLVGEELRRITRDIDE